MPVTLLGVPYDAASSFQRGPAEAPTHIRQFLRRASSNSWTEGGIDVETPGLVEDAGDVEGLDLDGARHRIETAAAAIFERDARPLFLGGDHSVTYPLLRAAHRRWGRLEVLHLDAHADLYDDFEGDRYSHACPFARALEDGLVGRLVQVGIRTLTAHHRAQARRFGVELHEMAGWAGPFPLRFDGPLYISLDIDVLDPAFAPGISHPEPGGLSVRDILGLLARVDGRLVGADLVEFNPRNDPTPLTGMVCAKLAKELIGRLA